MNRRRKLRLFVHTLVVVLKLLAIEDSLSYLGLFLHHQHLLYLHRLGLGLCLVCRMLSLLARHHRLLLPMLGALGLSIRAHVVNSHRSILASLQVGRVIDQGFVKESQAIFPMIAVAEQIPEESRPNL